MRRVFIVFTVTIMMMFGSTEGWGKEFKSARPGYSFHFPSDHGSHEDYQIEWWYFTGHFSDPNGVKTGFELTFFRKGIQKESIRQNPSKWRVENIYSAHFAISNESAKKFWFSEKISRNALGKADAKQDHFQVWIDQWSGRESEGIFYLTAFEGEGKNRKGIEFQLIPEKPVIVHGQNGVSLKDKESKNQSHYYSLTRLRTTGKFIWNGEVKMVEGISWMDHEFGSNPLLPSQTGWDWFSIQLNDRTELMLYQVRNREPSSYFSFGTLIDAKGTPKSVREGEFFVEPTGRWNSPGGGSYPMGWKIFLPGQKLSLVLTPSFQNQELTVFGGKMRYWEGSVIVTGNVSSGVGYVEMTGYASDFSSLYSQNGQ